jgi:DNA uptake protein ComE-like DNA-binding protein
MSRIRILSSRLGLLLLAGLFLPASLAIGSTKARTKTAKLDLNTATEAELENLPGVGAATAKKIIDSRPYSSVGDLKKAGIPKATVDKIRKLVTVSKATAASNSRAEKAEEKENKGNAASKAAAEKREPGRGKSQGTFAAAGGTGPVDLNSASQKELEALPGVGAVTARKIIAGRPYSSVEDLARAGVSKPVISKIGSRVTVGAAASSRTPRAAAASASPAVPSEAPARAAAPAPRPAAAPPPEAAGASSARSAAPAPVASGMVWVNTATGIYHYPGDRWYGKTKNGKYMTEQDAIRAGYRASKEGPKKK